MPNYLYLLVRTDMESLGRGKSVAQGAHAANAFTWDTIIAPAIQNTAMDPNALEWSRQANGFGTTIAFGATLREIEETVTLAKALGFKARVVADPEYPLVDGRTLHLIPDVVTGAYVFGEKAALEIILRDFALLKNDPV
ncbi:hypothetical protein D3C87_517900 [compost metagenome]